MLETPWIRLLVDEAAKQQCKCLLQIRGLCKSVTTYWPAAALVTQAKLVDGLPAQADGTLSSFNLTWD